MSEDDKRILGELNVADIAKVRKKHIEIDKKIINQSDDEKRQDDKNVVERITEVAKDNDDMDLQYLKEKLKDIHIRRGNKEEEHHASTNEQIKKIKGNDDTKVIVGATQSNSIVEPYIKETIHENEIKIDKEKSNESTQQQNNNISQETVIKKVEKNSEPLHIESVKNLEKDVDHNCMISPVEEDPSKADKEKIQIEIVEEKEHIHSLKEELKKQHKKRQSLEIMDIHIRDLKEKSIRKIRLAIRVLLFLFVAVLSVQYLLYGFLPGQMILVINLCTIAKWSIAGAVIILYFLIRIQEWQEDGE